jgi:hypothetical protein
MFDLLFNQNSKNTSSAINYVHELSKAIKNDYLSTALKSAILLYYDKFGEQRLIEIATCVELIISRIRFDWGQTRPSPVRIEKTLSWVKEKNIIPTILNSTVSSHVYSQLLNAIDTNPREYRTSPTLKYYKDTIEVFYKRNGSKIKSHFLIEKINTVYKTNNE